MPDTTSIRQTLLDTVGLDSINYKLALLQENTTSSPISLWIPLIASIVGGLLVLAGQAIDSRRRKIEKTKDNLLEIYSYCRKLEATMRNHYRELAMFKFHVEYWWHCYLVDPGVTPHKNKAYEEHLKSQSFARDIERQIGITKAEFIGHVRKFLALRPITGDIEPMIDQISDLTNPKANSYDRTISHHKLRYELAEKEEKDLREKYHQNLIPFKAINDTLKNQLMSD